VVGDIAPPESDTQSSVGTLVDSIYDMKYGAFSPVIADAAGDVIAAFWARPMRTFVSDGVRARVDTARLGALIRENPAVKPGTVHAFLNSAVVTLPAADACTDGLNFRVRGLASFDSTVLVWPLDAPASGVPSSSVFTDQDARPRTLVVRFPDAVCNPGPVTALIHSDYWWDYRFDVTATSWRNGVKAREREAARLKPGS
jgi:hypothetical protein